MCSRINTFFISITLSVSALNVCIDFVTEKKWRFPLRISIVNVNKAAVSSGFVNVYLRNPCWETSSIVTTLYVHQLFLMLLWFLIMTESFSNSNISKCILTFFRFLFSCWLFYIITYIIATVDCDFYSVFSRMLLRRQWWRTFFLITKFQIVSRHFICFLILFLMSFL